MRKRDLYRLGPDPSLAVYGWLEMREKYGDAVPDVDFPALLETHIEHGRTKDELLQLYVDYSVWAGRKEAAECFMHEHGLEFSPSEPAGENDVDTETTP